MPTVLFTPTAGKPFTVVLNDDGTLSVGGPPVIAGATAAPSTIPGPFITNSPLGVLQFVEFKAPVTATTLFTVPANKTLNGVVAMVASLGTGTATATVTSTAPGTLLTLGPSSGGGAGVTVAEALAFAAQNGASSDPITTTLVSTATMVDVVIMGYM
jgi:hypothetical protein